MSNFLSELGGLTEGVGAEALAFAAGFAAARALEPAAVTISQDAWNAAPVRRIPPGIAAAVAAENIGTYTDMESEASYDGWDASRFAYLYHVNLIAPGTGELLQMLRRGTINSGNFTHGLRKNKLEPMWDDAITELQNVYLDPAILAVMLQRNVIPDQGQLPGVTLDTTGNVPRFPQVPIDAYAMAAKFGWSQDQLDAQTRIQGLPPGMDLVARMVFRNILQRGDFNLAAEQSNRRVEWADFEFDGYREIPTARDFIEGYLRGWISQQAMYDGTGLHGMSQANTDLIYDISGRPIPLHQITTGLARGGTYPSTYDDVPEPYQKSLRESNIRPEWASLDYANRYTYPSGFQIKSEAPIMGEALTEQTLLKVGWDPELAKFFATHWAAGTGAASGADPHVTKAQTQLWTTIHTLHKKGEITDAQATAALPSAGVDTAAIPDILAIWDVESTLVNGGTPPVGQ